MPASIAPRRPLSRMPPDAIPDAWRRDSSSRSSWPGASLREGRRSRAGDGRARGNWRRRPDLHMVSPMRGATVAVLLATLLGFARTLAYDFVWDDALLIQRSQRLQDWTQLPALLSSHFWSEVHEGSHYYRPLVSMSFSLDVQTWGFNPMGFHLTNLLAHLATALAVLALARRLTGSVLAAAVAGIAFALHPIHTESVTFISGRTDVLATLFFLLALLGYVRWRQEGGLLTFTGSLVAFFLGLAAKEVAVTLPLVLVLYDRTVGSKEPRGRGHRPRPHALCGLRRSHRRVSAGPHGVAGGSGGFRAGNVGHPPHA